MADDSSSAKAEARRSEMRAREAYKANLIQMRSSVKVKTKTTHKRTVGKYQEQHGGVADELHAYIQSLALSARDPAGGLVAHDGVPVNQSKPSQNACGSHPIYTS